MSGNNIKDFRIETPSGVYDVFLDLEIEATPMHVGSLHLFEAPTEYRGRLLWRELQGEPRT